MAQLRLGTAMQGALVVALAITGCDGDRPGADAGRDSGLALMDSGVRVDSGIVGTDSGGPRDGGGGGACGPTGGACVVSNPTSCGAGLGCVLVGSSATMWEAMCIASGVLGQGDTCNPAAASQCREGFQCTGAAGAERCAQICCDNTDCDPGVICQQIAGASNAGFCRPSDACSIIDPASCGAGMGCYPLGTEGDTQCIAAGTATEGMTCAALNACVAGHGCAGDPAACRQYCNPASAVCATGFMCVGLTSGGTPIPGVGVCVPMATP